MQVHASSKKVGLAAVTSLTDETIEWLQLGLIADFDYTQWWERYIFHYATYTAGDYTGTEDVAVTYL
jgi:hypothetical protein